MTKPTSTLGLVVNLVIAGTIVYQVLQILKVTKNGSTTATTKSTRAY